MQVRTDSQKLQFLEAMLSYIPHVRLQGICVHQVRGDDVTLRMPYRDELVGNPATGAVHSGALSMLLDTALGVASMCNDQMPPTLTPTLDLRIDHLAIAAAGVDLMATARTYRVTSKIVFVEGFAWCDSPDRPVARAIGNFVRLKELQMSSLNAGQGDVQ